MWHVKSPSEYTLSTKPLSRAKRLGDIIDRVWTSSSEKPPAQKSVHLVVWLNTLYKKNHRDSYEEGWNDVLDHILDHLDRSE